MLQTSGWRSAPGQPAAAAAAVQADQPCAQQAAARAALINEAAVAAAAASQQQQPPQQQPLRDALPSTSDTDSDGSSGAARSVPLKLVVADAVKRWFAETLSEARRGDVKQQALLSQMYAEGFGCRQDAEQARVWAERARVRGYTMSGVYCEL